jgi:hypothetical protein
MPVPGLLLMWLLMWLLMPVPALTSPRDLMWVLLPEQMPVAAWRRHCLHSCRKVFSTTACAVPLEGEDIRDRKAKPESPDNRLRRPGKMRAILARRQARCRFRRPRRDQAFHHE